jgi:hypothetical protein
MSYSDDIEEIKIKLATQDVVINRLIDVLELLAKIIVSEKNPVIIEVGKPRQFQESENVQ